MSKTKKPSPPPAAKYNLKLEDDRKTVTLTLGIDQDPVVIQMDLGAIEEMLENLGRLRAAMKPEVAQTRSLGQKTEAVPNPIWLTEPELMRGDSLLHIRDPRYGWLHYLFPREGAHKLARFLQAQVDSPPLEQGRGKPS